jgi:hypothetical protein
MQHFDPESVLIFAKQGNFEVSLTKHLHMKNK